MDDQKAPAMAVVNGGTDIEVQYHDGKKETVKVILVPVRKFDEYMKRVFDLPVFAEFITVKPEGWADGLTDESLKKIDELGRELNDPRLDRYLDRQRKVVEGAMPMAGKAEGLTRSLQTP